MPYKISTQTKAVTIFQVYTKTGTTPPIAPFVLKSGSTDITNFSLSGNTSTDIVLTPTPLTASVLITNQSPTPKTVTITLIVKNTTDGTTLSTQGPTGFTTVGTGFTYQWLGINSRTYEVTASAANT